MKKQKKGFTLIELMVVIVIIGILAAIAIPKLFGMTAKAKASEVGPAAGTWSKLQQAYFSEKSGYGSWKAIAYRAPGSESAGGTGSTDSFTYTGDDLTSPATVTLESATWTAESQVKLGDCTKGTWTAEFTTTDTDTPTASIEGDDCEALTPNFARLK